MLRGLRSFLFVCFCGSERGLIHAPRKMCKIKKTNPAFCRGVCCLNRSKRRRRYPHVNPKQTIATIDAITITAPTVLRLFNSVHSKTPVSDSKIMLPASVSMSSTQPTLNPTPLCKLLMVARKLFSVRFTDTNPFPTQYSADTDPPGDATATVHNSGCMVF